MKFEKKLKFRRNCHIGVVSLGCIAVALGIVKMLASEQPELLSYYFTTGIAMIAVGIIKLRQSIMALSDKNKFESLHIKEHDEWNMFVRYKATYYAFAATVITSYMVSLAFLFIDSDWFVPFLYANSILVLFYLLFTFILRKVK